MTYNVFGGMLNPAQSNPMEWNKMWEWSNSRNKNISRPRPILTLRPFAAVFAFHHCTVLTLFTCCCKSQHAEVPELCYAADCWPATGNTSRWVSESTWDNLDSLLHIARKTFSDVCMHLCTNFLWQIHIDSLVECLQLIEIASGYPDIPSFLQ